MLKHYGVLKCQAIDRRVGTNDNAHYQIHVVAQEIHYRIAVNVKSQMSPSEILYYTDEHFSHPVTSEAAKLPFGFTRLESRPGGTALDYIRSNLFQPGRMVPLSFDVPGQDNDLNEKLDIYIQRAILNKDAVLYAFGAAWGPEPSTKDKIFGFLPGNGIHDIHMNQGNTAQFRKDDGVFQDGGLLIHFPSEERWIATFLAFQSQSWHTDDQSGHAINQNPVLPPSPPDNREIPADEAILITAALVKPAGSSAGETVTLLNRSDRSVGLTGWTLMNRIHQPSSCRGKFCLPSISRSSCLKLSCGTTEISSLSPTSMD